MRSERALRLLCAAALAAAATACNAPPPSSSPSPSPAAAGDGASGQQVPARSHAMLRTELYFERVDAAAWDDFLATDVTPRFPDGLSWLDINGQWRGPSGGPEQMPSRLLLLIHADNAHNEGALQAIATGFHARFGSNVLVVSQQVTARDADWTTERLQGHPQLGTAPQD